jgi:hypothetical protein
MASPMAVSKLTGMESFFRLSSEEKLGEHGAWSLVVPTYLLRTYG